MPKKDINLLPREEFEKKPLGRFLTWALSAGRYIVIFTELIVLIAFLSRFKLDRDLSDLYDKIQAKQAQITAQSDFEKEFRAFQTRLATIKTLLKDQTQGEEVMIAVAQAIPNDVSLDELSYSEKAISLGGTALSEDGLGTFLANLSSSEKFTGLNIGNISQEAGEGIKFTINAKTVKGGQK